MWKEVKKKTEQNKNYSATTVQSKLNKCPGLIVTTTFWTSILRDL